MKNRKQKLDEYDKKYKDIPKDYLERLSYMYDFYHVTEKKAYDIIQKRQQLLSSIHYQEIRIVLYEEPEGSPRPRFRIVNRGNLKANAMSASQFVHVYSITGASDNNYMKRLVTENDFERFDQVICTPCDVEYCCYFKTPSSYPVQDIFLAEIGLERPLTKPDWDNAGKKYSDMMNRNIWLDDAFVIDGHVLKYYSILPRIEIRLLYANQVFNRYQYNSITNRVDFNDGMILKY